MRALSAPTEAYGFGAPSETWHDPERGKGLAIAALCLSGAGLLIFPLFGLVGLVMGIVALSKQPASDAKAMAVTAVVLGVLGVLYGIVMAVMVWRILTT